MQARYTCFKIFHYKRNELIIPGIDLADQLSSHFSPLRKTVRWHHKVAFDVILNTGVINAYILYNASNPIKISHFRQNIILQLSGVENLVAETRSQQEKHLLTKTTVLTKDGRRKRLRCTKCYKDLSASSSSAIARKQAKQVDTYCVQYFGKPFLCLPHFQNFH